VKKIEKKIKDIKNIVNNKKSDTSKPTDNAAREGFCMSDKEINMLRGKQSNAIPVHHREQTEDVSPSDKSVFTDSYATF